MMNCTKDTVVWRSTFKAKSKHRQTGSSYESVLCFPLFVLYHIYIQNDFPIEKSSRKEA